MENENKEVYRFQHQPTTNNEIRDHDSLPINFQRLQILPPQYCSALAKMANDFQQHTQASQTATWDKQSQLDTHESIDNERVHAMECMWDFTSILQPNPPLDVHTSRGPASMYFNEWYDQVSLCLVFDKLFIHSNKFRSLNALQ